MCSVAVWLEVWYAKDSLSKLSQLRQGLRKDTPGIVGRCKESVEYGRLQGVDKFDHSREDASVYCNFRCLELRSFTQLC